MRDLLKTESKNDQAGLEPSSGSSVPWHKDRRFIATIAVFILLIVASVFVFATFNENLDNIMPEDAVFASTYNKKPSGLSGLYKIMKRANLSTSRWMLPYRALSGGNNVLLIVDPSNSLTHAETEQIMKWVKQGNRLIYLDQFEYAPSRSILRRLHLRAVDAVKVENETVTLDDQLPEASHAQAVNVSATTRLYGGQPLLKDAAGTIFTTVHSGKGIVIVGTCPDLVSNFRLKNKDDWANFQFLVNLCRLPQLHTPNILIDEKCHGFSGAENVYSFLGKRTSGLVLSQVLLILALAVYGASFRFGRLISISDRRSVSALDFIDGLAGTYKRARANALASKILVSASKQNWCKMTGTSVQDSDEVLVDRWAALAGSPAAVIAGSTSATAPALVSASATLTSPLAVAGSANSSSANSSSLNPGSLNPGSANSEGWRAEVREFLHQAAPRNKMSNAEVLAITQEMQRIDKRFKEVLQKTEG